MATKSFEVKKYWLHIWGRERIPWSYILCRGAEPVDPDSFYITFVEDMETAPLNESIFEPNRVIGKVFAPAEQYVWYLDLLRNEGPVYAHVNESDPSNNHLSTSAEPVGEGER